MFVDFEMKVIDQGPGISEEGIKKLFVNFQKLNEHNNINKGGTGLGLSICKQLINKMGGEVSVNSELGKGSVFKINM